MAVRATTARPFAKADAALEQGRKITGREKIEEVCKSKGNKTVNINHENEESRVSSNGF